MAEEETWAFSCIQQIVVVLLQLCIWKEALFLSSFTNPCTNPKQRLYFLLMALSCYSRSPSSCFTIALFLCLGICVFFTLIFRIFLEPPLQGRFLVLGCTGMRKGSRARSSLPMPCLVLPSTAAPLQRDQAPTYSSGLVWDPGQSLCFPSTHCYLLV